MPQFLKVKTAEEVLNILSSIPALPSEHVPLPKACSRILASDIRAAEPVPNFPRATMDGFAVRARDTFGASENLPALLEVSGEVLMGAMPKVPLGPGNAVAIPTGGMLPEGADAVVMVEYTSALDERMIEVNRPVAPGDNILREGDDIRLGDLVFKKGRLLRPQDVGLLAALGITEVEVHRVPRVAVISTGDEIVPVPTHPLPPGKVRDINTYALAAQLEAAGAEVGMSETVSDRLEDLVNACRKALESHDMLVLSGGSSVGVRDYTLQVLESLPHPELLVHGVAIRPGKPVILGRTGSTVFWGLPGQPVSALITCRVFVISSLYRLQGREGPESIIQNVRGTRAILNRQLPSVHGRTDFMPVFLSEREAGRLEATPIFGKSGAIGILARADGYVIIPEHVEGLDQGTEVTVFPFS